MTKEQILQAFRDGSIKTPTEALNALRALPEFANDILAAADYFNANRLAADTGAADTGGGEDFRQIDSGEVQPQITDIPGTSPLFDQTSVFSPGLYGAAPIGRTQALQLQSQYPQDVFSRFLEQTPGFSTALPFLREGLKSRGADVASQGLLAQVGNPNLRFENFLAGQGTQNLEQMRAALQQALALIRKDPATLDNAALLGIQRELQSPESAFGVAIQPTLATIAPNLRGSFVNAAADLRNRFAAVEPERSFLEVAGQKGFF